MLHAGWMEYEHEHDEHKHDKSAISETRNVGWVREVILLAKRWTNMSSTTECEYANDDRRTYEWNVQNGRRRPKSQTMLIITPSPPTRSDDVDASTRRICSSGDIADVFVRRQRRRRCRLVIWLGVAGVPNTQTQTLAWVSRYDTAQHFNQRHARGY